MSKKEYIEWIVKYLKKLPLEDIKRVYAFVHRLFIRVH